MENDTLEDLEKIREAVENDLENLYLDLKKEVKENGK